MLSGHEGEPASPAASHVLFTTTAAGVWSWVSAVVQDLLGWTPQQLVGHPLTDLTHPDDVDLLTPPAAGARVRMRDAEGHYTWLSVTLDAVGDNGTATQHVGSLQHFGPDPHTTPNRFRALFENTSSGLVVQAPDGQILDCNPAAEAMLGMTKHQLIESASTDPRWRWVGVDGTPLAWHELPAMVTLRTGEPVRDMVVGLPADDHVTWLNITALPFTLPEQPESPAVITSFTDVTVQVTARAALTASEEHYRLLADQVSDVVVRIDVDDVIRWVSPSVQSATGWKASDVLGASISDFALPADTEVVETTHERLDQGQTTSAQARLRMADGSYRWFDVRVDHLHGSDGAELGRVARLRDIDDERRAEEALERTRERLRLVVESSDLGTWDWNMVTGELVLNERWAQMLGYTLDELQPVSIDTWTRFVHPDDLTISNALIDTHARGFSDFYEVECRLRHRDGMWVWVLDRGKVVEWTPDAKPLRMTGTHQDITDRKEAEQRLVASESRYRSLVERMADVVVALDPDATITFASPSFGDLLGWPPEEWVGRSALELLYDDADREAATAEFESMLHHEASIGRLRLRSRDGEQRWVEVVTQAQHTVGDTVTGVIAAWRDVTEATRIEAALREESKRLSAITEHMGDVVIHLESGVISWVSPSIADELGGPPESWIGVNLPDRVHPDDQAVLASAQRRLDDGRRDRSRLRLRDLSDAYHWVDVIGAPAGGHDPHAVVLSLRMIDDDVAREGSLRKLAGSDSLTGLANRRELMNRLAGMLCDRGAGTTAVIFCDVDNLKQINDSFGHPVGDAMLIATANRLQAQIRPDDLCARFGGDEFVILLGGISSLEGAVSVAERIRLAATEPIALADATVMTTISIGVAVARRGETPGPLMSRADAAMYQAKKAGRNRTVPAR